MNPPPFSSPSLGQPPQPSAFARFVGLARGFAGNTLLLGVLVLGAEKMLPPGHKPSDSMGAFLGNIEQAETIAKQQAAISMAAQMAEVQARANARAAMEIEINRQQQQSVADSLAAQSTMANLADLGCVLGQFIPRDASDGWQAAGAAGRSGCGASARIRQNMVQEQARAGRQGGSIQARQPDYSDLNRDPDAPPAPVARRNRYEPPELAEQRKYYPTPEQLLQIERDWKLAHEKKRY